ncbi:PREDICTED: pituitary tumor-transforming gene 1 protein-interacting protein-like [Cyprinodon variegatus]|uniref:Pituitary tumor-transforming gene 1 protein-interacting protein-like n=1 Tax=Cyprinodon variegatus TaxID=28743 RepID=A0A3Q2DQR9_CYPVA|nr:PREDICTED: pituitary tumor-transforming gene 1 protein-interacting protein-like [Cyprinodon variegatus]
MFGFFSSASSFFSFFSNICFVVFIIAAADAETTTPSPAPAHCSLASNTSCDECLQNVACLWCSLNQQCIDYPVKNILPPSSVCPLNDARWGVCWVNFQILIITMSVLAGVIIIAILVCCFCCCKCERIGSSREDAQVERQTRARKARQKARKTEIQMRHDEIRHKYGITKENPYARMNDH